MQFLERRLSLNKTENSDQVIQTSMKAQVEKKKQPLKLSKNGIKLKRTSLTRAKNRSSKETKQDIYGLDVDFLKEIGKTNIVEVKYSPKYQDFEERQKKSQESKFEVKCNAIFNF